jgi:hypothetical protein
MVVHSPAPLLTHDVIILLAQLPVNSVDDTSRLCQPCPREANPVRCKWEAVSQDRNKRRRKDNKSLILQVMPKLLCTF